MDQQPSGDGREVFAGACQCGATSYRVSGRSLTLFCCHCTECRAQSGSAFGMALWIAADEVELGGLPLAGWTRDTPSGQHMQCQFCPACGTRLFHRVDARPGVLSIKPGTLHSPALRPPVAHIWTDSAPGWSPIDPACLHYRSNPPDFAPLLAAWDRDA